MLRTVVSVSKSDLCAGDPVSIPYEEAAFLQGLPYDYVVEPEVCIFQAV